MNTNIDINSLGTIVDDVRCIGVCDLMDAMFGEDHWKERILTYTEEGLAIDELFITKGIDYAYYSRQKEDFFVFRAAELAQREGVNVVIMENLS